MAIVKMKKLTLAVSADIKDSLLHELQAIGSVHIDSLDNVASDGSEARDSWAKELTPLVASSSENEDIRRELAVALSRIKEICKVDPPAFEITSAQTIENLYSSYNFSKLAQDFRNLDRETRDSESLAFTLKQEMVLIKKWVPVVDNFDAVQQKSPYLRGVLGVISESSLSNLVSALAKATELADLIVVYTQDKEAYCYILAAKESWDKVASVLKDMPFNAVSITRRSGDTAEMIKKLEKEIDKAVDRHNKALALWADYAEKVEDIALIHDTLEMELQKQKANSCALMSDSVCFFRAWVPEDAMPKVSAMLSRHKTLDVKIEDPVEDEYETVPVSLKNNILTSPFSALTSMYGTPMYGATVDPTPHLSIFYFIYYGFCLGDAIYGAVLALFSLYMTFKNRADKAGANFYALLAWSGLSATIAGVIFGSYAGDLLTKYFPVPFLSTIQFRYSDGAAFFDKPLFVLFVSLVLGAVQLWYGYFIKFVVSFKKNAVETLFCNLPWLILLTGFFLWAVLSWIASMAGLNLVSPETTQMFFSLMKIGACLILVNAARLGFKKGLVAGLLGPLAGLWDLYGISGYLSNLLSYARLLALGLSSGIIANVFNQLSFGLAHGLAEITPLLSVFGLILLIFLHLFNLVLGGFGAFVHALRLQFVEFFGQFMEGGGKEYNPLKRAGVHYVVK